MSTHAAAFLREGTLYPWVEPEGAALMAQALAQPRPRLRRRIRARLRGESALLNERPLPSMNVREAHNALAFSMLADARDWRIPHLHPDLPPTDSMLQGIGQQMRHLAPRHLVICSEVMSHFGLSAPDQIDRLAGALDGADLHLWCNLRRPDQQAVSWHGQRVRFGHAPRPLSDPEGLDMTWLHFDYRGVIEPWLQRLPDCRVTLRPYHKVVQAGGSIPDFIAGTGMTMPADLPQPGQMNISRHPAATAILREANAALPHEVAREMAPTLSHLARSLPLVPAGDVELIGAANRARMLHAFRPIHDWLSKISGAPFFQDLDDMLTCLPVPEADAAAQLLALLRPHLDEFTDPAQRDFLAARLAAANPLEQAQ